MRSGQPVNCGTGTKQLARTAALTTGRLSSTFADDLQALLRLESANKQIKENYTLRKKLPFKHFIQAVEAILRAASKTAQVLIHTLIA